MMLVMLLLRDHIIIMKHVPRDVMEMKVQRRYSANCVTRRNLWSRSDHFTPVVHLFVTRNAFQPKRSACVLTSIAAVPVALRHVSWGDCLTAMCRKSDSGILFCFMAAALFMMYEYLA
jgi:hypothetical protein